MPPESAAAASAQTETASPAGNAQAAASDNQPPSKIDPITAVQDSIDGLALSLFEALRGVRDAVAPESLEVPGARPPAASSADATPVVPATAFQEASEEMMEKENATPRERLLSGLNVEYFPPRAFDLFEPDYEAFLLAYLSDNPYAKELVERFSELDKSNKSNSNDAKPVSDITKEIAEKSAVVEVGDVGYEFRKKFGSGWYDGKVTEIRPLAENGYDRRCVYSDGDIEDLRLEDLELLAKLDPKYTKSSNKLSINLKALPNQRSMTKTTSGNRKIPLTQKEYTKLLIDSEHQRDVQTTSLLAHDILAKSAAVNDLVANLPGMNRTRQIQMERIDELIKRNHDVTRELEEAYAVARKRREEVRVALGESTCLALGVEEDV